MSFIVFIKMFELNYIDESNYCTIFYANVISTYNISLFYLLFNYTVLQYGIEFNNMFALFIFVYSDIVWNVSSISKNNIDFGLCK